MKFDFYIEKIKFNFDIFGTGSVTISWNGNSIENFTVEKDIRQTNHVSVSFRKADAGDEKSYAVLRSFLINGYDFTDDFKTLDYHVDTSKHDVNTTLPNNLYFGYVGKIDFIIQCKNDLLSKAAWTIAENEFEYIKFPSKTDIFRPDKNKEMVISDARSCFFGFSNIEDKEMIDFINNLKLDELKIPLRKTDEQVYIQEWINQSNRISFLNFDAVPNFCFSDGIIESINSFMSRTRELYIPTKVFYMYREILEGRDIQLKDIFKDDLKKNSNVILELPSPWYSTDLILSTIKKAKSKNCKIALDMTWLPITNDAIDLDLNDVDEIYFGMNKTWPTTSYRPSFRWTRNYIQDVISFKWNHTAYSITSANIFLRLVKTYDIDYIYKKYLPIVDKINKVFELDKTPVLWFNRHKDIVHNDENYISRHFYHNELVGMKRLVKYHGKYFW